MSLPLTLACISFNLVEHTYSKRRLINFSKLFGCLLFETCRLFKTKNHLPLICLTGEITFLVVVEMKALRPTFLFYFHAW